MKVGKGKMSDAMLVVKGHQANLETCLLEEKEAGMVVLKRGPFASSLQAKAAYEV